MIRWIVHISGVMVASRGIMTVMTLNDRPVRMFFVVFGILAAFLSGTLFGGRMSQATLVVSGTEQAPRYVDLDPVWKAWRLLEDRFVSATTTDALTEQDRVWGMIEGLAAVYDDPYTVFMPPRASKQFEEEISGSFGGVGIEIGIRNDVLTIIAPLRGTPGERAGLRSGDLIVSIDGVSTQAMTVDEAIERIRGEVGTKVSLKIARASEVDFLEVPVVRETIDIPTLETKEHDGGILSVALFNFGGTAESEMRDTMKKFLRGGYSGLVLDLRGNPGGYLDSAVEIASYFLPMGKVVVSEVGREGAERVHRSKGYGIVRDETPIVVLVDGGSASASEILAGALGAHDRAPLVGTKTFGKGSVQELLEITPDTSLKVTIARWFTPDGVSISDAGLTPDLLIERTAEDIEQERDPQMEAALTYLRTGVLPEPTPTRENTATTSTPRAPRDSY